MSAASLRYAMFSFGKAVKMVFEDDEGKKYLSDLFGKVNEEVETEKNRLISNRDLVRVKVEATDQKTDKVSDAVFEWLKETDILMQEVENLTLQARKRQWNEYRKLLGKITALNEKCEFEPFSTPIPSLEHFSSGNILCFQSRDKTSDQLLEALRDDNCSMIGLYGSKGSGKTALAKAMGEKVKYLKIFHEVLFATVTQNLNIKTMQAEIADLLEMPFDRNSEAGRARRIFSRIESMSRPILVIFDDVRVKFDPEDVGIPCNSNRCKILLIARSQQDCELMYSQRDIQLGPLSTEESWTLFQKHSGIHDGGPSSSFDLLTVAREVSFECKGLARTIKDVGFSLRGKPIEEWKVSLDSLRHSMAKWQIFLSFRGEDTRYSFTGSLYQALCQGEFKTFMYDGGLHNGDQISPTLLNAIEESRLSIIILSENYANSSWCLEELVKILECKELKNQLVWPIFYKVDPSDIRHMRKSYGQDMARHENNFGIDSERVQKWKSALFEVSNLSGKAYTTGYEHEFIQKIVEDANCIKSPIKYCIKIHSMAKWQIFLSFRGEDTRNHFTRYLYQALCQGELETFMDDGGLLNGDQISPTLLNAIENSRLSIIILSENYANSSWCLEELVKIMECMKLKNQLVWPIFYKVDPSDIRHMRKSYGKDMARHENNFGIDSERVQKWKSALFEVSSLPGKAYTSGYEYEFIQKIVEDANRIKSRLQI